MGEKMLSRGILIALLIATPVLASCGGESDNDDEDEAGEVAGEQEESETEGNSDDD